MIHHHVRSGHAPVEIRCLFVEANEALPPGRPLATLDSSEADPLLRLAGRLWNCTDILPGEYGEWLDLPPGATYAEAARLIRHVAVWRRASPFPRT